MVLISIHPFALRKLLLVIVAFLCFSAFCFADPVLMVQRYAPPSRQSPEPKNLTTSPESLEARPDFGPLGVIDSPVAEAELDLASADRLVFPLPSSLLHKAMCELRSADFRPFVAANSTPFPREN